jgi:hypothetical protein
MTSHVSSWATLITANGILRGWGNPSDLAAWIDVRGDQG